MSLEQDLDDYKFPSEFPSPGVSLHRSYRADWARGKQRALFIEKWARKEPPLGAGAFGTVYLEQLLNTDKEEYRAVKELRKRDLVRMRIDVRKELVALTKFSRAKFIKSQVFVTFSGWFENVDHVFIAMEYFQHGTLERYITKDLSESDAQVISLQLIEGIRIMHEEKFTHRDLKPQNIFIVQTPKTSSSWWIKIGDFGISKRVSSDDTALRTYTGTQQYLAPEVHHYVPQTDDESDVYTDTVDIWSFGCVVYQMLALQTPFSIWPRDLVAFCKEGAFPETPLLLRSISAEGVDFVKKVLIPNPALRPSAQDALAIPWVVSYLERANLTESFSGSTRRGIRLSQGIVPPTNDSSEMPQNDDAIFKVRNETGFDINLWADKLGEEPILARLQDGEEIPWSSETVSIGLRGSGYDGVNGIAMNNEGESFYTLRPRKDELLQQLVVDNKLRTNNFRHVVFRSTLIIENNTPFAIDIGIFDADEGRLTKFSSINPSESRPAPMSAAYTKSFFIRPQMETPYKWSGSSFFWKDLLDEPTRSFSCSGENGEATVYFQIHTPNQKPDKNLVGSTYPQMRIKIFPPLEIENQVAANVTYRIYDKQRKKDWTNHFKIGTLHPILVAELSSLLLLSIKLEDTSKLISDFAIICTGGSKDYRIENTLEFPKATGSMAKNFFLHYYKIPDGGGAFRVTISCQHSPVDAESRWPYGVSWLKLLDKGKYADDEYVGQIELSKGGISDGSIVMVTYDRMIVFSSRPSRGIPFSGFLSFFSTPLFESTYTVSFSELKTISKEKTGISLVLKGGGDGPFFPIENERDRARLYTMLKPGVKKFNEQSRATRVK